MFSIPAVRTGHAGADAHGLAELKNASYHGLQYGPVKLSNGVWEGPPFVEGGSARPRVGLVEDFRFSGDLKRDSKQDTVVILWESSAGTGSHTYVAVMADDKEGIRNIDTALIGDRVKLLDGKIEDGKILLKVLQAGENDAMCCPTMLATRSWSWRDGQLSENETEMTGTLSLAVLEATKWTLTQMDRQAPVIQGAEITLAFGNGRVSGKSACNRYSAAIESEEGAGEIRLGPSMSTRMACPESLMRVERRYLDRLSHVTRFSFDAGRLTLSGQDQDSNPFTMLFSQDFS